MTRAVSATRLLSAGVRGSATGVRSARAAPPGSRPTWVEVDLDAIKANVGALKAHASEARPGGAAHAPLLMAVVKADGYGHGMVPAAQAALAGGADWLGVALVEEGLELRAAGVKARALLFSEPPVAAVAALLAADLTPTGYTLDFLAALDAAGRARGRPVALHLKLDTGMRRVGVPPADWEDALTFVRDAEGLRLDGLWSHFAVADEPGHPLTAVQTREFERGLALAERLGVRAAVVHLANSPGLLAVPDSHHDLVRTGLSIYGLEPAPGLAGDVELRAALSWFSRVALVKRLQAGESLSYGSTWTAATDTTIATVPAGYADGVTRLVSNRGRVLIGGCSRAIVGNVTMDQFMVDAGDADVRAGDEVCLLGKQGDATLTAADWAASSGTINYEVVTTIGKRVPRVYLPTAT